MPDETELTAGWASEALTVSLDKGAIDRIADLATEASADVLEPVADHVVPILTTDHVCISLRDLEEYQPEPRRRAGTIAVSTPDALIDLTLRHSEPGTVTYVDVPPGATKGGAITTVVNDHVGWGDAEAHPGWRDHRITYPFVATPEWEAWLAADGNLGSQGDFAEMIDDLRDSIVTPDAATLLEIAQTFHANSEVKFSSAVRIASGEVKLTYDEAITTSAGKGRDLAVPAEFVVETPTFMGGPKVRLVARLRYRVSGGSLAIGFKLLAPHEAWAQACDTASGQVRSALEATSLVVDGSPG